MTTKRYAVVLKRTIYATVHVEAETAAEARRQFDEEESRWEAFNGADCFHGEDTKLATVKLDERAAA
jgi:hypothetical protein